MRSVRTASEKVLRDSGISICSLKPFYTPALPQPPGKHPKIYLELICWSWGSYHQRFYWTVQHTWLIFRCSDFIWSRKIVSFLSYLAGLQLSNVYYCTPTKLWEGKVFSHMRVCLSLFTRVLCDHYLWCIGSHCTGPPVPNLALLPSEHGTSLC